MGLYQNLTNERAVRSLRQSVQWLSRYDYKSKKINQNVLKKNAMGRRQVE